MIIIYCTCIRLQCPCMQVLMCKSFGVYLLLVHRNVYYKKVKVRGFRLPSLLLRKYIISMTGAGYTLSISGACLPFNANISSWRAIFAYFTYETYFTVILPYYDKGMFIHDTIRRLLLTIIV